MGIFELTKPNGKVASIPHLLIIVTGAITFLVYYAGLAGPFVFDDEPNIVKNQDLHIASISPQDLTTAMTTSVKAGSLNRPVSYLSFALNYYFFGDKPYSFKFVNVIIHILTGLSLFVFTQLLMRIHQSRHRPGLTKSHIAWIALIVFSLWVLHPLGLSSVLYVVQRMTSLSALFTILSLICYLSGRLQHIVYHRIPAAHILGCLIFMLLALFSKENAALIPYYIFLIELCVFKFKTKNRDARVKLIALFSILIVPFFVFLIQIDDVSEWLTHRYNLRPFTLSERLLTETRVVWNYIKFVIMPRPSELGLFHDDISLSSSLLRPLTTLMSLGGLLVLLIAAFSLLNRAPIFSFGILFFLVGHIIESSIIPLEIAHEHRNYLPMFGLLLIIGYYSVHPKVLSHYPIVAISGLLILVSMNAAITAQRALQWSNEGELVFSLAQYHPNSARSNYAAGRILTGMIETDPDNTVKNQKHYELAIEYFTLSYQSDRSNLSGLFGILYLNSLMDKAIEPTIVAHLNTRLSEEPLLPAITSSFRSIHKCWVDNRCSIDGNLLANLYRTALKNPLSSAKTRMQLLNDLGLSELQLGNPDSAINHFQNALELSPNNLQLWLNLIQTLILSDEKEEANIQLKQAKRKFPEYKDQRRLDRLETQLDHER